MKNTIFSYEKIPECNRFSSVTGKKISVYDNGEVTSSVVQANNKVVSEEVIARIPGIVLEINDIIDSHKNEVDDLPVEIRNGIIDGEFHCFVFWEKTVSGYNLRYCDVENIYDDGRHKDAAICTNRVLDIFNEIVILMNRYCIRHELLREIK